MEFTCGLRHDDDGVDDVGDADAGDDGDDDFGFCQSHHAPPAKPSPKPKP